MKVPAISMALVALSAALSASAQDVPTGMVRAVPNRPTRVFIMAAFDDACSALPAPAIEITEAPRKGSVQLREGQATTVQSSLSGKCVGARVLGTGIYYAARADAAGEDRFSISARLATGEVATRTFQMFITDSF